MFKAIRVLCRACGADHDENGDRIGACCLEELDVPGQQLLENATGNTPLEALQEALSKAEGRPKLRPVRKHIRSLIKARVQSNGGGQ